ncbi:hypothetical protein [Streptomyces sp. 4F14]|uniref:hypothetical protein n=1 Tax=Streptomyces sp. 4F14 TaxID=3394380 RepID=UPI003A874220
MIERIQEAVQARDAVRLAALWEEIGEGGDAFHRCVLAHHSALAIRGFYPSLHLNLAESYRKTGDLDRARSHVAQGRGYLDALAPDAYGDMIRGALERLAAEL